MFTIRYHPDVKKRDLPLIDEKIKTRIKAAIETRLLKSPEEYSAPLRK